MEGSETMTCARCGNPVKPRSSGPVPKRPFCSEACRVALYHADNPERTKAKARNREARHHAQRNATLTVQPVCKTCGVPTGFRTFGGPRKYCDSCSGDQCPCGSVKNR